MKTEEKYPHIETVTFWLLDGKKVRMFPKNHSRRIYSRVSLGHYSKVYFKVVYGMAKTSNGRYTMFYNEYEGSDPKEAYKTLRAFMEGI
jgi:hypothetical protein